jgi:outer membrane protein assembly factor BamA
MNKEFFCRTLNLENVFPWLSVVRNVTFVFSLILLFGCNNTRHIPKGDALYTGARIKLSGTHTTVKQKKVLQEDLLGLTRPKPNTKILGMRIKLSLYNFAGDTSKKGFLRKFLRNLGEPPVLLSGLNLEKNEQILQNHLDNAGYFTGLVKGDTVVRRKKAHATYQADAGPQYTINTVSFAASDSSKGSDTVALFKTIKESAPKSLLQQGAPFNLTLIKAERDRIDAYLKERGFYYFSADDIIVQVDSTIGNYKVNMYVNVKDSTPIAAFDIYHIRNVYVYPNYRLNMSKLDTSKTDAVFHKGYYVVDPQKKFKPKLFEQALKFNPGDIYNRTDHNLSLSRLVNLGVFKFVKNRFEESTITDTPMLDAYYYLTPLPRLALSATVTGSTKSNNLTGTELTFSWRNRNTIRAGELLILSGTVGSEVQYGGPLQGYNTFSIGGSASLAFPRFIIPFTNISSRSGYVPRTAITASYELLDKQKLYTLNSFRGEFGYLWKENIRKEHRLSPIAITYVIPANITPLYADSAAKHPSLQKAIERQFILGSTYNYNYNQLINSQPVNSIYFNGLVDVAGNLLGLVVPVAKDTNTRQIFGEDFAQYVKLESDLRFYRKLGLHVTWANRLITGFGYPYGNSKQLPFIKQFYAGGNNSIRAFRSRSVGPGTFRDTTNKDFLPDQTGDLKLELNTEMRVKFSRIIEGAAFVDAGNVWLYRKDPNKPGGEFTADFIKQLAVGTGVGLRLDFTFFLIRFDVAFPLRKPWLSGSNKWVFNEIDFTNPTWRGDNIIYNLAIGYPF